MGVTVNLRFASTATRWYSELGSCRSIAMLRRAGFRGRSETGTLHEYELALCGS